jgi:hypothetical protein
LYSYSGGGTTCDVTSKTNAVLIRFTSDASVSYSGYALKVSIIKQSTIHHLQVAEAVGGSVMPNKLEAYPEDKIQLTVTPDEGYMLDHIKVQTANTDYCVYDEDPTLLDNPSSATRRWCLADTVRVRENRWFGTPWFLMPYVDATITPCFTSIESSTFYANVPKKDTLFVDKQYIQQLLDNGKNQFHICDHGGPNGGYTNNVNGYLRVTVPEGYVMNINGPVYTENNYDYVYIYDGMNTSATRLGAYCGSYTVNTTTTGNVAFFRFSSDGGVQYDGFNFTVTVKKKE